MLPTQSRHWRSIFTVVVLIGLTCLFAPLFLLGAIISCSSSVTLPWKAASLCRRPNYLMSPTAN